MRIDVRLTETDIREAIRLYLAGQGWRTLDGATFTVTPGDRPGECATITATVGAAAKLGPLAPVDDAEGGNS